jgi:hypothetical protein
VIKPKVVRIGVDFDGVVAYNPFRLIRAPVKWFKKRFLGISKTTFFVPKTPAERLIWIIIHESSFFPARGTKLLNGLATNPSYEFHLVTGRYGFLKNNLMKWLKRYHLDATFKTININENCEQPHIFKDKMINKLKLDAFIEDNLDIVRYLENKSKTKILWIFNIFDRKQVYPHKFPYLESALKNIIK